MDSLFLPSLYSFLGRTPSVCQE